VWPHNSVIAATNRKQKMNQAQIAVRNAEIQAKYGEARAAVAEFAGVSFRAESKMTGHAYAAHRRITFYIGEKKVSRKELIEALS
jgi:hypothetical protein